MSSLEIQEDNWRHSILQEFTPGISKLTLVADPDGLLLEEKILEKLSKKGFELISFDDHIEFRFAYESKYRSVWDRGLSTSLVVVLRSQQANLNSLPFDLLQAGRSLSFNLGELFPHLSYPVIDVLDRADLDTLYTAYKKQSPAPLGDNNTRDFVLLHVFKVVPETISEESELLKLFLRIHYSKIDIPQSYQQRLIKKLCDQNSKFSTWPLQNMLSSRTYFLAFLQERWGCFLLQEFGTPEMLESSIESLTSPGPNVLPFAHDDVRVFVDNLFAEGLLQPIEQANIEVPDDSWAQIGCLSDPTLNGIIRAESLVDIVAKAIPNADSTHSDWLSFALKFAELKTLIFSISSSSKETLRRLETVQEVYSKVTQDIDPLFNSWLLNRFSSLHNLPARRPVMVHHIPTYARHLMSAESPKVAVVVIDALSIDQWILIRDSLLAKNRGWHFNETSLFAWIPTVTSVSRQALFAGKPPLFFQASIHGTSKEPSHWEKFWGNEGYKSREIGFIKSLGKDDLSEVREKVADKRLKAIGLVVNTVDEIGHGMKLGMNGMYNQLAIWSEGGYLQNLFELLSDSGFRVLLTADHGNIEATGFGRPSDRGLANTRGERVRVYPNETLREQVAQEFQDTIKWPSIGLPEQYFPLLADNRGAFKPQGENLLSHGGCALEEVIVPFVEVSKAV